MKILCIKDLDGFYLTKKGNFNRNGQTYYIDECIKCGDWFYSTNKKQKHCNGSCSKTGKSNPMFGMVGDLNPMFGMVGDLNPFYGKKHTKETKEKLKYKRSTEIKKKMSKFAKKRFSKPENNVNWKGGYDLNNIPTYDVYDPQIDWCEQVRRNKEDKNILEVRCAYCGKWYIPKLSEVTGRISALNGNLRGEYRFYCSNGCKQECPIYGKTPATLMKEDAIRSGRLNWIELNREVQPELRQMVLKRDNYTCIKCGSTKNLHCHHLEGIRWEPLESADIDKCTTLCKNCHVVAHKKDGCGYNDMKCEEK